MRENHASKLMGLMSKQLRVNSAESSLTVRPVDSWTVRQDGTRRAGGTPGRGAPRGQEFAQCSPRCEKIAYLN